MPDLLPEGRRLKDSVLMIARQEASRTPAEMGDGIGRKRTKGPATPSPLEDYVNWGLALLSARLTPSQTRSSTAERIQHTEPGRFIVESSHIPTQWVVELMTEMRGIPLPVASAVDRFKAIPAVEGVRLEVDADRNHATLCVVVRMPKYDDALMNKLVAEEAKASEFAKKHGYVLEFTFLPKELAGLPDLDDADYSCFLD